MPPACPLRSVSALSDLLPLPATLWIRLLAAYLSPPAPCTGGCPACLHSVCTGDHAALDDRQLVSAAHSLKTEGGGRRVGLERHMQMTSTCTAHETGKAPELAKRHGKKRSRKLYERIFHRGGLRGSLGSCGGPHGLTCQGTAFCSPGCPDLLWPLPTFPHLALFCGICTDGISPPLLCPGNGEHR